MFEKRIHNIELTIKSIEKDMENYKPGDYAYAHKLRLDQLKANQRLLTKYKRMAAVEEWSQGW